MSITEKEENIRIKLGAKLATEIECLTGLIVLFHDVPFPDEAIDLFKTLTVEEITEQMLGGGYESHDVKQYFNN